MDVDGREDLSERLKAQAEPGSVLSHSLNVVHIPLFWEPMKYAVLDRHSLLIQRNR